MSALVLVSCSAEPLQQTGGCLTLRQPTPRPHSTKPCLLVRHTHTTRSVLTPDVYACLLPGVLVAIITFGSPLPALLEADRTGDIKVPAEAPLPAPAIVAAVAAAA